MQGLADTQPPAELRTGEAPPSLKPVTTDAAADNEPGGDSPLAAAATPGKAAAASLIWIVLDNASARFCLLAHLQTVMLS